MSVSVDKLSLLGALAPLRQYSDSNGIDQATGFAEKFDKALGNGDVSVSSASSRARELAESLTLQMLQSSLSLAGDSSTESTVSGTAPLSSANSILKAYRSNLAAGGDESLSPPQSFSSQLQEMTDGLPSSISATDLTSQSGRDASWLDPIIARASQKYGVEVGLIKAVIKAESGFDPQAVSHAGARGLMQLMPATARSLGVSDSFDPEQNVMGGTRFLKDMLKRYDGNVDSALAAYNWGPGNVDKRPDSLPRETREYLARVKQLYASYRA